MSPEPLPPFFIFPILFLFLSLTILPGDSLNERSSFKLAQSKDCGDPDPVPGDVRTEIPWTVAIFYRTTPSSEFKFLVSGALLGPWTVLTVAGGLFGALPRGSIGKYRIPPVGNFMIAVGLNTTNINSSDEHTQFANVSLIIPNFNHPETNKQFHFVIYHLETPLNLKTPYARSICLPFALRRVKAKPFKWQYLTSGYSLPLASDRSLVLRSTNTTTGNEDECASAFRYHYGGSNEHVFCTRSSPGQTQRDSCHLHGSISSLMLTNRWFLSGITVLIPSRKRRTCDSRTLHFSAYTLDWIEWMFRHLECPKQFPCGDGRCLPLGDVCNGRIDCTDGEGTDENEAFCEGVKSCPSSQHQCSFRGGCIERSSICDSKGDCENDTDESVEMCLKERRLNQFLTEMIPKKNCPIPNASQGTQVSCYHPETHQNVTCTNPLIPGTMAKIECTPFNSPNVNFKSVEMKCGINGKWENQKPFFCSSDCGIIQSELLGKKFGELPLPWHALIYKFIKNEYIPICSGTLIEDSFLLSSAGCGVFKEVGEDFQSAEKFKVVLAPSSESFTENSKDSIAQILNVKLVLFAPGSDIGLIKVSPGAKLGYIRPVCYLKYQYSRLPNPGKVGTIANDGPRKLLNVRILRNDECQIMDENSNLFCGVISSNNDSNIANLGMNLKGTGIFFQEGRNRKKYILKGIASGKRLNEREIFTHVDAYSDWIIGILESTS